MVRVSNGLQRHARHKKYIARASGFRLGRSNLYKQVRLALVKQGQHEYDSRKLIKRDIRQLWIERINAALVAKGTKYSVFMGKMSAKGVVLNRKVLSNIAVAYPEVFTKIYENVVA